MSKEWISIADKFPDSSCGAYFISGHEWFGIGIWENGKGWVLGFVGEWPYGDHGAMFDEKNTPSDPEDINHYLNQSVMWWKEIIEYPYHGKQMCDVVHKLKNQPERSKREDSFCEHCESFIRTGRSACFCSCGLSDKATEMLYNRRCGALNTVETQ